MSVRRATLDDLDELAPLFDAYRVFYGLPIDPEAPSAARDYLAERMRLGESIVLVAPSSATSAPDPTAAPARLDGFTQLYPTFCSLELAPVLVLYDLFVRPDARGRGTATALLEAARRLGVEAGACRLELSTAHTNTAAQRLYESLGWQPDAAYRHYELPLR